jgi:RimJ/RimL family protein N-acetyltransferase
MNQFSTARLCATRLAADDLQDLVELHLDPDVSRYLGGVRTPEATAAYLHTNLKHWIDHGVGLWALRTDEGLFMGRAGLRYVDLEGVRELEIAYTLVKAAWRKGLATEIAHALIDLWRRRADPSLVGLVMKENKPSERVLLKAGFEYERDAIFHDAAVGVFRLHRDHGAESA